MAAVHVSKAGESCAGEGQSFGAGIALENGCPPERVVLHAVVELQDRLIGGADDERIELIKPAASVGRRDVSQEAFRNRVEIGRGDMAGRENGFVRGSGGEGRTAF